MSTPPLSKQLPRQIDPRKLVTQGIVLAGVVPTAIMSRLADAVVGCDENALATLSFARREDGKSIVAGDTSLKVEMECQRCLRPVEILLEGKIQLAIVWDEEQAGKLPPNLDPWILPEESADLYEMVEDELLLALPIMAYHQEEECAGKGNFSTGVIEDSTENPFSVLAQLKQKQ